MTARIYEFPLPKWIQDIERAGGCVLIPGRVIVEEVRPSPPPEESSESSDGFSSPNPDPAPER
jgi:hypothetical protein